MSDINEEINEMNEEDRVIVEFTDEDGGTLLLEELDTFFYNGEEFAVLGDVEDECDCDHEHGENCDCDHEHEHEHSLYIMKMETSTDEDGEEVVDYIPVEEKLMDALVEVVQTRFFADDDEEDEEGN